MLCSMYLAVHIVAVMFTLCVVLLRFKRQVLESLKRSLCRLTSTLLEMHNSTAKGYQARFRELSLRSDPYHSLILAMGLESKCWQLELCMRGTQDGRCRFALKQTLCILSSVLLPLWPKSRETAQSAYLQTQWAVGVNALLL